MNRGRLLLDFLKRGRTHRYGPHASQVGDLHLPAGPGPHPLAVTIHGGSWQARYGRMVMRGLAADLVRRGFAVWNVEYRRVGEGGGWTATFDDAGAAIDHARLLDAPLDLDDVTLVGHSAGGHLALWAAGRTLLPAGAPGAEPALMPGRVLAQAPVSDLVGAHERWRGGAVRALMGGSPQELPDAYALADPIGLIPAALPILIVHGVGDETVSVELSRGYAQRAGEQGADVELVELQAPTGGHRAHIDPRGPEWRQAARWLARMQRARG